MLPEGPLRRLAKVEDVVGDLVDRGVALVDLGIALQLWVREDFDHPFDPIAELITGKSTTAHSIRDRRGQGAYHIEARELSRTSEAYAYDARQPAVKGGHGVTRFGMWGVPDGSAQNCGSCWSGLHPASGRGG